MESIHFTKNKDVKCLYYPNHKNISTNKIDKKRLTLLLR